MAGELENARHELFAVLLAQGKPQSEAYKLAGYKADKPSSAEQGGSRLSRNLKVAERVAELKAQWAEQAGITTTDVIRGLAAIAFADPRKVMSWGQKVVGRRKTKSGKMTKGKTLAELVLVSSKDLDDDVASAVKEVSITADGRLSLKMHDKLPALVKLGEHLGMFQGESAEKAGTTIYNDNRSVTFVDAPRRETVEEWQERVAREGKLVNAK